MPISIASALAASSVPALTAAYTNGKKEAVRSQINTAIRFIMVVAFPCAVGIGVLASPILQLLFRDSSELAASMLQLGAVSIVFFSLSTLSNGLLQGINRMREPVKNALIALVLHIGLLVVLMYVFKLNIYAVVYANAFFGLLMCVLNAHSVKKLQRLPAGDQTYLCDTGHFCAHYGCCSLSVVSACIISLSCECDCNRIQYFDRCDRLCSGSFAAERSD